MHRFITTGTFGQEVTWNLGLPTTYQHPMKSKDLLLTAHTIATPTSSSPTSSHDQPTTIVAVKEEERAVKPHTSSVRDSSPLQMQQSPLRVTEIEEEIEVSSISV